MINILGSIFGTSGYVIHTRELANALYKQTKVRLTTNVTPGVEKEMNDAELNMIKAKPEKDEINLIIDLPTNWKLHTKKGRNWAYCIWEGDKVPDYFLEEFWNPDIEYIFVPSEHTFKAIEETVLHTCLDVDELDILDKIKLIPHGVDLEKFYPNSQVKKDGDVALNGDHLETRNTTEEDNKKERKIVGVDNQPDKPFVFLANKGFRNMEDRGGIQYLIKAYLEEFKKEENVELIIKLNPAYGIPDIKSMFNIDENSPKISLIGTEMPYNKLVNLYNECDVFVSPTRAEAFNLPCLEAMACGKPVITTNYGGQTDYVNESNGWLINYKLTEVEHEVMYEGIKWATPGVAELKAIMRDAFSSRDSPVLECNCTNVAKKMQWSDTAKLIVDLI